MSAAAAMRLTYATCKGKPARADALPRSRRVPATCSNASLNHSDHAACLSTTSTCAPSTTFSMHGAWPAAIVRSRPESRIFQHEEFTVAGPVCEPVETKVQAGRSHEHPDHMIPSGLGWEQVTEFAQFL